MDISKRELNSRKIMYGVTTTLVAAAFLITGIGNLIPFAHIAEDMSRLGYPPYFLKILGVWKVLAAIAIASPGFPRLKEWAYAGMIFDLTGAAVSRAATGEGVLTVVIPIGMAGLVLYSRTLRTV